MTDLKSIIDKILKRQYEYKDRYRICAIVNNEKLSDEIKINKLSKFLSKGKQTDP